MAKERPAKFRSERNSNPGHCDAGAVLHQLSYQANWQLGIMWVFLSLLLRKSLTSKLFLPAVQMKSHSFNCIKTVGFFVTTDQPWQYGEFSFTATEFRFLCIGITMCHIASPKKKELFLLLFGWSTIPSCSKIGWCNCVDKPQSTG